MQAASFAPGPAASIDGLHPPLKGRVFAFELPNHYIAGQSSNMRAEISTIVEEIKQSLGLLRRHL
jgi:hypothetical protein